jgi:hypothetical protein
MRNVLGSLFTFFISLPLVFLALWVGAMVLGAIGKVLLSGVPIVLIGGCLLFAYQMFVKG